MHVDVLMIDMAFMMCYNQRIAGWWNTRRSYHNPVFQGDTAMAPSHPTLRSGIYQIRCLATGRIYIGSASNFQTRWATHRNALAKGMHHSQKLQRAWVKYGADAFVFEVLELVEQANLTHVEQEYLDRFHPFDAEGYNISPSAESCRGVKRSPEHCAKISAMNRGRKHSEAMRAKVSAAGTGRIQTDETKAKRSATLKGRVFTPEWCARISVAKKGKSQSKEGVARRAAAQTGGKRSEETKAKMRDSAIKAHARRRKNGGSQSMFVFED